MKILVLAEASVVHSRRWVEHFRLRGWTVRWLSFPPIPPDSGAELLAGSHLRRALAIPMNIRRVRRVVDEFGPDIISALFLPDYGWLGTLCKCHPLAVSVWGSDVLLAPKKSTWHHRRIESVLRSANWLFTDADLLGRAMCELGADPDQITIAPLGVEDSWLDIGRNRAPRDDGPVVVMTCRQMEPLYRVDTFLHAAARLVAGHPGQFKFVIGGDGSMRGKLEQLSNSLGLGDQVRFSGLLDQPQLQTQYSAAGLYISCSSSDGTSVSMLEAMAAGCVPIVTDLEVNREWIEHGTNGLLFPVGDDHALSELILQASSDIAWMHEVARRNIDIVTRRARWRDNMTEVEKAMVSVIENSRKAGTGSTQ